MNLLQHRFRTGPSIEKAEHCNLFWQKIQYSLNCTMQRNAMQLPMARIAFSLEQVILIRCGGGGCADNNIIIIWRGQEHIKICLNNKIFQTEDEKHTIRCKKRTESGPEPKFYTLQHEHQNFAFTITHLTD